jgi:archaellum component FlaC
MASSVSSFAERLKRLQSGLEELAAQLKRVDAAVGSVYEALLVTRKVDNLLKGLYDLLEAAQLVLKALSKVPYVNAVATPLEQLVGKIKDQVKKIRDRIDQLEKRIEPKRERLKEIGPFARDLLPPIQRLQDFVSHERSLATQADGSIAGQPAGRYKRSGRADLDRLISRLDGLLDTPLKQVADGRSRMETVEHELGKAAEPCGGLADVAKTISSLMEGVEDLADDAETVRDTLEFPIGVGTEVITIRSLLDKLNIVPKEIVDQAMKVLEEPLRQLKSSLGLRIPDPIQMISAFETILRHLGSIEEAIKAARPQLEKLVERDNLIKPFDAIAA